MFTGLVDHTAKLLALERRDESMYWRIATAFTELQLGESIALDGICLTVTDIFADGFGCLLSSHTCMLTTAAQKQQGDFLNIERSLKMGDALGGHWVMGHVDGRLTVASMEAHDDCMAFVFSAIPESMRAYCVSKGSVAINGVSLTINQVHEDTLTVMCIPHTLAITHLGGLKQGDQVNVEYDYLAKMIRKQVEVYV